MNEVVFGYIYQFTVGRYGHVSREATYQRETEVFNLKLGREVVYTLQYEPDINLLTIPFASRYQVLSMELHFFH